MIKVTIQDNMIIVNLGEVDIKYVLSTQHKFVYRIAKNYVILFFFRTDTYRNCKTGFALAKPQREKYYT